MNTKEQSERLTEVLSSCNDTPLSMNGIDIKVMDSVEMENPHIAVHGHMTEYEYFKNCTNTLWDGDVWDIECKLGLWGVTSIPFDEVQDEALHYFRQYWEDGEYEQFLKEGSDG